MKVVYKEDWFVLRAIIDKFCNKWFRGTKRQKYPERTLVFDIAFSELLLTKLLSSAGKYATLSFVSYEFKQLSHRFFSFPEAKYSLETILKLLNKPSWGHLFFSSLSFFLFFFFFAFWCARRHKRRSYLYSLYNKLHSFWLFENWAIGSVKPRKSLTLCIQSHKSHMTSCVHFRSNILSI